ncbi:hypothetical protein BKA82DRAFT_26437 [Pisolithus tinctorius]|uniref:Uncharacterized protein n=1 Tax=Pisolithus tinctorius Marx 270 TaxID=870435 RepID=A0A0C3P920_PISTI|nr:hypothetical protein BKA82DRAFT_26437 [Pisolithus tinctorius]KIO04241.1 hypothetical protein M404DRAFT_26437 [Pisolithus tinctorius Marx 270]
MSLRSFAYLETIFPSGPLSFTHPDHLEEALALTTAYDIRSASSSPSTPSLFCTRIRTDLRLDRSHRANNTLLYRRTIVLVLRPGMAFITLSSRQLTLKQKWGVLGCSY